MTFRIFLLILLYLVMIIVGLKPLIKTENNYGLYTLRFDNYSGCKGPKPINLTKMVTDMNAAKLMGFVNFTFLVDAKIEEIKVQVHSLKDKKKSFLWSYKLKEPCKHYAFAVLIKQQLRTTNCFVRKGNYTSEVNFGEVMHSFLGDSFFYGTYYYKADLISKKGNIACFNTTLTFMKKTRT